MIPDNAPPRAPQIVHGDCLEIMKMLPDNSVDSVVTDPPYGLGFMGKAWDVLPPGREWAEECLRVLKPGGHLLAFGGSRTWHRLAVAVEDAGFEIRDSIAWLYGSGFPKSMNVAKAITATELHGGSSMRQIRKARLGDGYEPTGQDEPMGETYDAKKLGRGDDGIATELTPAAEQWQGWGTALKPAFEPIVFARKPLIGTVAANVQAHGTGALNIDGCRIGIDPNDPNIRNAESRGGEATKYTGTAYNGGKPGGETGRGATLQNPAGRWPANVALDEHTAAVLDEQSGRLHAPGTSGRRKNGAMFDVGEQEQSASYGDNGGASRFFYVAKAPKKERPMVDGVAHATVKPLALMRWLVRLVTPAGGTVLEPFAGSGTTVEACILEGFHCIAIEREAEYLPLIQARIDRQAA